MSVFYEIIQGTAVGQTDLLAKYVITEESMPPLKSTATLAFPLVLLTMRVRALDFIEQLNRLRVVRNVTDLEHYAVVQMIDQVVHRFREIIRDNIKGADVGQPVGRKLCVHLRQFCLAIKE